MVPGRVWSPQSFTLRAPRLAHQVGEGDRETLLGEWAEHRVLFLLRKSAVEVGPCPGDHGVVRAVTEGAGAVGF